MGDFNDEHIKPNWSTGEDHIYKNVDGSFTIRRVEDGIRRTYARFKNLEDAVKYRDFCIKHEWKRECQRRQVYISEMEIIQGWKVVE